MFFSVFSTKLRRNPNFEMLEPELKNLDAWSLSWKFEFRLHRPGQSSIPCYWLNAPVLRLTDFALQNVPSLFSAIVELPLHHNLV